MSFIINTIRMPNRSVMGDFSPDILPDWAVSQNLLPEKFSVVRMDVYETDGGFHVRCECPGVAKEKITCTVENNTLTVKVAKDECTECEGGYFKRRERRFGSSQRSVYLPDNIDQSAVKCSHKDGILSVDFPKLGGRAMTKLKLDIC